MPPRGNEGLDFTPIITHYLFLFTSVLSVLAWFISFIGQAIATARFGNSVVGVLWFAIWLQLLLIIGVVYTLASDSVAMHRFQIATFGAVALVFAVHGVNAGIFTRVAPLAAMSTGWLLLAMVDILWVLYFTSEDDSLALHVFNSMGNGGLSSPSRRPRARTQNSMHNMSPGNGYATNYGSGGISSHDVAAYDAKIGSSPGPGGVRSNASFGAASVDGGGNRSIGAAGSIHRVDSAGPPGSLRGADNGPSSPLMSGPGGAGSSAADPAQEETYSYKAKALFAYTASADDPNEISFTKGEILDVVDKAGKWWQARKADGTLGIAPSNYLQLI